MDNMPAISIGVPVHNESKNIGPLIESILAQKDVDITEVIFIASGCTDGSVGIIEQYLKGNSTFRLIKEKERKGKAAAINLFLGRAKSDVCVVLSSDIVLEKDCLYYLVRPLRRKEAGMSGARAVPISGSNSFICLLNRTLWDINDRLSRIRPKLGEAIAFRNIIDKIPYDTAVDEASIEAFFVSNGYRLYYAEKALIRNRCPVDLKGLFLQRLRIFWGHIDVSSRTGYNVSSMALGPIAAAIVAGFKHNPRLLISLLFLCLLEIASRTAACYKYYIRKIPAPFIWPEYEKR